ncbi:MAG: 50S ribosomal protein L15 [Candidatus Omnitrophica bacterium]|nr:50S ribosomal protein L15 [Candidatus Omnitrophota bacterium]
MKAKKPYQKKVKRIGRGSGSGHGKTATKGHKGQKARSGSGARIRPGFEGGQNPLYRQLPKRGFNQAAFRKEYTVLNLDSIAELQEKEITPELLQAKGKFKKLHAGLKVLGRGTLKSAVVVKAHKFSDSAKAKIEQAGGQAIVIESAKTSTRES